MNLCGLMGKAPLKQFKAKNKYNSDASQLISLTSSASSLREQVHTFLLCYDYQYNPNKI